MKNEQFQGFYEFGEFLVDPQNCLLLRASDNEPVALTLKEFEVLFFLMENAGRGVRKDDLLDAVWNDTFVEEGTLARTVSRLRKKLGEASPAGETFIETLPKRGYRFLPHVVHTEPGAELMIEEEVRLRVRVEDTVSVADPPPVIPATSRSPAAGLLPAASANSRFRTPLLIITAVIAVAAVSGFLISKDYFGQKTTRAIMASRIKPFSGATGRENTPAFSRDGKQVAFAWDGGDGGLHENLDVYIRLVNAVEPLRLTHSEFREHYPVFSPDGASIAFVREYKTQGEVMLSPAMGGAERRIARLFSGNFSISFAPDGQSIAVIDTDDSSRGKQYQVYIIDVATGERRRLTAAAEFVGETTPRYSPDGRSIAFLRVLDAKRHELFVSDAAGGTPRQLTFDGAVIHSVAWAADGREIFFISLRSGSQSNIWRVSAEGDREPELISAGGREITNIAVSPDSKTIAFVENIRTTDIWQKRLDEASPKRFAASIYSEYDPAFSPDGSRVSFTSNRTGQAAIWISDADGKNLRQLTEMAPNVNGPRFSPDGSRVVYNSNVLGAGHDLFVVSIEGGTSRLLTEAVGTDKLASWSADGRWIYFSSNRTGDYQIWRIPADGGGEAMQITRQGGIQAHGSPDGKTVFYTKNVAPASEKERIELWHAPADGGTEAPVPGLAPDNLTGSWDITPSGIYYLALQSDDSLVLRFYDFGSGKTRDVVGGNKIPTQIHGNIAVTADAGRFLYSVVDQNASSIMFAEIGE